MGKNHTLENTFLLLLADQLNYVVRKHELVRRFVLLDENKLRDPREQTLVQIVLLEVRQVYVQIVFEQ